MKIVFTLIISFLLSFGISAQSMYGYMGKRFYLKGALSAGPSILGTNIDNEELKFKFNITGTFSAVLVMNKKQAMSLNYKRYSGIASINSSGLGVLARKGVFLDESQGVDIGAYRFRTNEFGWNYQFFSDDLDAPLGNYITIGIGFARSKYDVPIQTLNYLGSPTYYDPYNPYQYPEDTEVLSFDNNTVIKSPILRLGIGKQTVFWDRFLFDVGVDFGFNLAFIPYAATNAGEGPFGGTGYDDYFTQAEFDYAVKSSIQTRVFFRNLVNFRMGLAILLF